MTLSPPGSTTALDSNYTAYPVRMLAAPLDHPRAVTVPIDWERIGQGNNLQFNAQMQRVSPLTQICALHIDNTRCELDVTIFFPDTQLSILAPAGSQGYYPVTTAGLQFYAWADPMVAPGEADHTTLLVLNFLPPPGMLTSKAELTLSPPAPGGFTARPASFQAAFAWRVSGTENSGAQYFFNIPPSALPTVPFSYAPNPYGGSPQVGSPPKQSAFFMLRPMSGANPSVAGNWIIGVWASGIISAPTWQAAATWTAAPWAGYMSGAIFMPADAYLATPASPNGAMAYGHDPTAPPSQYGEGIPLLLQCTLAPTGPIDMIFGINAPILAYA